MAERGTGVDERPELPSVELIEGFGVVDEAVAERSIAPARSWKIGAVIVAVAAVAALLVSFLVGGDDPVEEAAPTTAAPPSTTAAPPRTTLPPVAESATVAQLPGVRPSAELVAAVEGDLYRLDLNSGEGETMVVDTEIDQLFDLDGVLVARSGRELLRVFDDGSVLALGDAALELTRGYGPASVVSVSRDGGGVVARILGPDGVFRAGARLPGEAVVHGAVNDRLVVTLAGSVVVTDGTDTEGATTILGPGRVLAIGPDRVVRLVCDVSGCRVVVTDGIGAPVLDTPLPEPLASAAPDRWDRLGWLSPDGTLLMVELTHGNGSVTGAAVIDLVTGEGQHSPELGTGFGRPAWAPDSRFVLYPFDGDVMVWDVRALDGQLRSARASIRLTLSDVSLR